ncbi:MAG: GNAT family N-acetyltransferase [Bacteroidales bacterium]|nr:GNAT family N-acetyltransferase [Bacteroidales bacterium]
MITFREQLVPEDIRKIGEVLESSGFFHSYEVDVASELASINLEKGAATSGYHFIIAHEADTLLGYCCYGPNPCTESSYDLYWIAVHKSHMKKGLGRKLMYLAEQGVLKLGGTIVWVETSGRAIYESTRKFYLTLNYERVATLPDFYAPGDDKIVFMKRVG